MSVIGRAELLLQAKNYSGSGEWLDEANSHNAQFGSTSGVDTNDPQFLAYSGEQYLSLPGVSGNFVSVPDSVPLSITGDLELIARLSMADWSPAATTTIITSFQTTADQRRFRWQVNTSGAMVLAWTTDGTSGTAVTAQSSSNISASANDTLWIRTTIDVSGFTVQHFTSTDTTNNPNDVTWVQLGNDITGGATSIHDGTQPFNMGANIAGTGNLLDGTFHRIQMVNGIGGTVEFDADFTDTAAVQEPFASFSEKSSNAATVTINRSATGRKSTVVDRPMFLLGTDNFFEIPDDAGLNFDETEDFTIMAAVRGDYTIATTGGLIDKMDFGAHAGYRLTVNSGGVLRFVIEDDAASAIFDQAFLATDFTAAIYAGVRDQTGNDDIEAFTDGVGSGSPTDDTTATTLADASVLRFGSDSGVTPAAFWDGEIHAVVLWREALSDNEIIEAGEELLGIAAPRAALKRRRLYQLRVRGRAR